METSVAATNEIKGNWNICEIRLPLMNHTHHYSFWHSHDHSHIGPPDGSPLITWTHSTGHYHNWMQTHEHGAGGNNPHPHKARQYHADDATQHHHALDAHDIEEEAKDVPVSRN